MRRGVTRALVALGWLLAVAVPPAGAQSPDEVRALRQELEGIRKDLEEIKALLRARPTGGQPEAPREVAVRVDGAPAKGDAGARVTLVEFTDYQCPFCGRHFRDTMPQLDRDYIKTGKLRYVMRDFPLEQIHPLAFKGHEAARCAGDQGRYWEMHDQLFANQQALEPKDLVVHARAIGLDVAAFEQCLTSERHAAAVRADFQEGVEAGVNGTPMFFLGMTQPNGTTVKAARVIRGAQPYAAFRQAIESLLSATP